MGKVQATNGDETLEVLTIASAIPSTAKDIGPEPTKENKFLAKYLAKQEKIASADELAAKNAKQIAQKNIECQSILYQKAEGAVTFYKKLSEKQDPEKLIQNMDFLTSVMSSNLTLFTEAISSIEKAKTAIQASKNLLTSTDDMAEKLKDEVRRTPPEDPHLELAHLTNEITNLYAEKIENATDDMNDGLNKINGLERIEIKTDEFKRLFQEAKPLASAFKTDWLASSDFSNEQLKKSYLNGLTASIGSSDADYKEKYAINRKGNFITLKKTLEIETIPYYDDPKSPCIGLEGKINNLEGELRLKEGEIADEEIKNLVYANEQEYHQRIKKSNEIVDQIITILPKLKKELETIGAAITKIDWLKYTSELLDPIGNSFNNIMWSIDLLAPVEKAVITIAKEDEFNKSGLKKMLDPIFKINLDLKTKGEEALASAIEIGKNFQVLKQALNDGKKSIEDMITYSQHIKAFITIDDANPNVAFVGIKPILGAPKKEALIEIIADRDSISTKISAYKNAFKDSGC